MLLLKSLPHVYVPVLSSPIVNQGWFSVTNKLWQKWQRMTSKSVIKSNVASMLVSYHSVWGKPAAMLEEHSSSTVEGYVEKKNTLLFSANTNLTAMLSEWRWKLISQPQSSLQMTAALTDIWLRNREPQLPGKVLLEVLTQRNNLTKIYCHFKPKGFVLLCSNR